MTGDAPMRVRGRTMISSHPRLLAAAVFFLFGCVATARAASVTVTWDPDPDPDVTGYTISYGAASGQYTKTVDVGLRTSYVFTGMPTSGKYYFVVTAYNFMGTTGPASAEVVADMSGNKPATITNPGLQRSKPGDNVSLGIVADDQEGGGLKYAAGGLPPGLRMDTVTGVIAGTIGTSGQRRGIYRVLLTVVDAGGATSSEEFEWVVGELTALNDAPRDAVDFNADGSDDLFLHNEANGDWMLAFSDGEKFRAMKGTWAPGWQAIPVRLNDDGASDLFFYDGSSGAYATGANNGAGSFVMSNGQFGAGWVASAGQFSAMPVSDGLFYNPSDGRWTMVPTFDFGKPALQGQWQAGRSFGVARFNADTLDDVMLHDPATGSWTIMLADGQYGWRTASGQWTAGYDVYPVSINADGIDDALLYNPVTGDFAQAVSNGEGVFAMTTGAWRSALTVRVGDFNGDGRGEAVLYDRLTGTWASCTMAAGAAPACSGGSWFPGWDLVVGDFNGDKADDLLFNRDAGSGWSGFRFDGKANGRRK